MLRIVTPYQLILEGIRESDLDHFDLRTKPWMMYRRLSGVRQFGNISELTHGIAEDPIVAIASPRPDFDGAITEFLIGILGAALHPRDEEEWLPLWNSPPEPEVLAEALAGLPDAFRLAGPGPRFLQDLTETDLSDSGVSPIERLLFESPGEQTLKLNKDLFVKRGLVKTLSRPAAAAALLAMQTYAPAGGQGNRTSMRGGGPLTTLVDPRPNEGSPISLSFWRKLWANVLSREEWVGSSSRHASWRPEQLFPWLARTRTSERGSGVPTTPSEGHPLQAYFGMPRRIRLEFSGPGTCDITGDVDEITVTGFRMRNYGVEYSAWQHPLTPYYRAKAEGDWLAVHGQPGGMAWKDWVGLLLAEPDQGRRPSMVVANFSRNRSHLISNVEARVHAFGADFDNMKCRGWTDAMLPFFPAVSSELRVVLKDIAANVTVGTELVASLLVSYVKAALFPRSEDAKGDFSAVKQRVWDDSEADFYGLVRGLATGVHSDTISARREFLARLEGVAFRIFDDLTSGPASVPETVRRVVKTRYWLSGLMKGRSNSGGKLYQLVGLMTEDPRRPRGARGRKGARSK